MSEKRSRSAQPDGSVVSAREIVEGLGSGLLITAPDGVVLQMNPAARRLLGLEQGDPSARLTCCELFGCRRAGVLKSDCVSRLAADASGPLPEIRVDIPPDEPQAAVWLTAKRLGDDDSRVLIETRSAQPGDRRRRTPPHWLGERRLAIRALGRTIVETNETTIEGEWLLQRPGSVLKYLVCQRRRPTNVDEIVEALWPGAGAGGRNTVRQFVHQLRQRLEPDRGSRRPSSFITSVNSTYVIDSRVALDIEEFEALVDRGAAGIDDGDPAAVSALTRALELYRGDLFAEDPYAEWAYGERASMQGLADRAMEALANHFLATGEPNLAIGIQERRAAMWPLDAPVQRRLIEMYLISGRRSEASRRYKAYRDRLQRTFGIDPDFTLAACLRNVGATT